MAGAFVGGRVPTPTGRNFILSKNESAQKFGNIGSSEKNKKGRSAEEIAEAKVFFYFFLFFSCI